MGNVVEHDIVPIISWMNYTLSARLLEAPGYGSNYNWQQTEYTKNNRNNRLSQTTNEDDFFFAFYLFVISDRFPQIKN